MLGARRPLRERGGSVASKWQFPAFGGKETQVQKRKQKRRRGVKKKRARGASGLFKKRRRCVFRALRVDASGGEERVDQLALLEALRRVHLCQRSDSCVSFSTKSVFVFFTSLRIGGSRRFQGRLSRSTWAFHRNTIDESVVLSRRARLETTLKDPSFKFFQRELFHCKTPESRSHSRHELFELLRALRV